MKTAIKILAIYMLSSITLSVNSQQVTYSGPIEYKFIRTKIAKGTGSKGYNWNVDIDEKYIIEGTFYVTFTGHVTPTGFTSFHMTSIEEEIQFENSINNRANEERISQVCTDDRMKSARTVSPGDSRIYRQTVKHERLDPNKPCVSQGIMTISPNSQGKKELSSGKYSVMVSGVIETEMTSEVYSEQKFACNPDRNAPPQQISQTFNMPIPVMIVFEEYFDGLEFLTGKKVILDKHSTDCGPGGPYANMTHGEVDCDFEESIVVSWKLNREEECDILWTVAAELDKREDLKDFQKERIKNVLRKLKDPSIDAWVFLGTAGIKEVVDIRQADIVLKKDNISLVDLRELFDDYCEKYGKDKKGLTQTIINADRYIIRVINMFNEYYFREHMMSDGQVKIKDWIADQQRNPNSIYNAYPDE